MGLVTRGLVAALAEAGLVPADAPWQEEAVLGDWLAQQGISLEAAAPVLERLFGLPYLMLEPESRLHRVAQVEWPMWQVAGSTWCVCVAPPSEEGRRAYESALPGRPLAITDSVTLHSILLRAQLSAVGQQSAQETKECVLETLLRQEGGHVDGAIGRILADALAAGATDVHLTPMGGGLRVVWRVAGQLVPYAELPVTLTAGIINKLKLLAAMDIAEHRLPQDGHIQLRHQGQITHLRLGSLPLAGGEKLSLRLLPERPRTTFLQELDYAEVEAARLEAVLAARRGLVLITGPTNSGKTTTLYACLSQLAGAGALVYTIEDPIEAVLPEVQQMQVNVRGGLTYEVGLRGILRSDADVIAVGELRDKETVAMAARAALSGQLVLATLHAATAHEAVDRLRDLGLSDLLLGAVLQAVANQRLLSKICERCYGRGYISGYGICEDCLGKGFSGRQGVQEVWRLSPEEQARVADGDSGAMLRAASLKRGFHTLADDAAAKGLSPGEEVLP